MIAHIVVIKLQEKSKAAELKAALETLPAQIPEIKKYEVGIDEVDSPRSFHIAIYSHFENFDTLKIYNDHPAHVAVAKMIGANSQTVHAVDYTL